MKPATKRIESLPPERQKLIRAIADRMQTQRQAARKKAKQLSQERK